MKPPKEPPRLQAYLERTNGISAFATPRSQWEALSVNSTQLVAIDVANTPIRRLGQRASMLAIVASQTSTGGGQVSVYRHDPKDGSTPVNVDRYSVWTDLGAHPDIQKFLTAASTSLNPPLRRYMSDNVFWVKEAPGPDHWLTEVPSSVTAAVRIVGSTSGPFEPTPHPGHER